MANSALTDRQQVIIQLLEDHTSAHDRACETLDSKAQDIINLGGVLFVLFGSLNIAQISGTSLSVNELMFSVVTIIVSYLLSLAFALYSRRPTNRPVVPLSPTTDAIHEWIDAPDLFDLMCKSYQAIISKTLEVETKKAKWVKYSLVSLVLMINFMIAAFVMAIS